MEALVIRLAKEGHSPSKIGIILRDIVRLGILMSIKREQVDAFLSNVSEESDLIS